MNDPHDRLIITCWTHAYPIARLHARPLANGEGRDTHEHHGPDDRATRRDPGGDPLAAGLHPALRDLGIQLRADQAGRGRRRRADLGGAVEVPVRRVGVAGGVCPAPRAAAPVPVDVGSRRGGGGTAQCGAVRALRVRRATRQLPARRGDQRDHPADDAGLRAGPRAGRADDAAPGAGTAARLRRGAVPAGGVAGAGGRHAHRHAGLSRRDGLLRRRVRLHPPVLLRPDGVGGRALRRSDRGGDRRAGAGRGGHRDGSHAAGARRLDRAGRPRSARDGLRLPAQPAGHPSRRSDDRLDRHLRDPHLVHRHRGGAARRAVRLEHPGGRGPDRAGHPRHPLQPAAPLPRGAAA
ncbi:hypothetical protein Ae406Ps2_0540c [Pseudonocardia sp. Ae406_Ps2]|nr:hypothetical protein Ae406Ps2_0540c [Pseudonocardia sp. Ae406_Ps2]OLM07669.1 hypothetical protein Ae331Ps2_5379 [Pseudonocardia sp. Ae331_Ps2]OLM22112.1 hypothetical protein Ae706Ps2_0544c [Pseudonocardia sp. Ae706_Ps2]